MNVNGLPIGSIVTATDEQFIALYQHKQPTGCTQSECVEEYKLKQGIAKEDAEYLRQINITSQQIAKKLDKILEKVHKAYKVPKANQPFNLFERPTIDIEEDGIFSVSRPDFCEMGDDVCSLCDYKCNN